MTDLAQAYVQLVPSMQGMQGSIERLMNGEAATAGVSSGRVLGAGIAKAATAAISAAAIGKTISASITEGAALEQSIGGIETLFKNSSDKVIKNAKQAYKTAGMSANTYMEQTTSFAASLLQSVAGDTDKAADIANMAMIDMSDNANKMGTNMQDIQNAYQGFAKQNYTMLDNLKLGYGGTKSEMERLLADAQELTGVEYNIDNLADVYEAIHAIQQELDITGTTAKEAQETFSGSLASMKAAFSDLLGNMALGENIEDELKAVLETTSTFLFNNFLPMLVNIGKSTVAVLGSLIGEAFSNLSNNMPDIPNLLAGVYEQVKTVVPELLNSITEQLPQFLDTGVEIILNIANGIMQNIPMLLQIAGELVTNFAMFVMNNFPIILQAGAKLILGLIDGIITYLPQIILTGARVASDFILSIANKLPEIITKGREILQNLVQGIDEKMPELISTVISMMGDLLKNIANYYLDLLAAGVEIIDSLLNGIISKIGEVLETIKGMGRDIIDAVKNIDLFAAGKAIIDGFVNGLKSAWEAGKNFVGGIARWIRDNKGPISYDRKLLIPAGKAIMGGLNEGLADSFEDVKDTILNVATEINDLMSDNINDELTLDADVGYRLNQLDNATAKQLHTAQLNTTQDYSEREMLVLMAEMLDRLDGIQNKNMDTYLDRTLVSRELSDPIRKQQEYQSVFNKRMRGAW